MPTKPRLVFVVVGEPTAANPLAAFKQCVQEIPGNEAYLLRGRQCADCGLVELEATEAVTWPL